MKNTSKYIRKISLALLLGLTLNSCGSKKEETKENTTKKLKIQWNFRRPNLTRQRSK